MNEGCVYYASGEHFAAPNIRCFVFGGSGTLKLSESTEGWWAVTATGGTVTVKNENNDTLGTVSTSNTAIFFLILLATGASVTWSVRQFTENTPSTLLGTRPAGSVAAQWVDDPAVSVSCPVLYSAASAYARPEDAPLDLSGVGPVNGVGVGDPPGTGDDSGKPPPDEGPVPCEDDCSTSTENAYTVSFEYQSSADSQWYAYSQEITAQDPPATCSWSSPPFGDPDLDPFIGFITIAKQTWVDDGIQDVEPGSCSWRMDMQTQFINGGGAAYQSQKPVGTTPAGTTWLDQGRFRNVEVQ